MPELNGKTLRAWARRAVNELAAKREEINKLNVFPVPDSDTGSNMAHTMESALAEVDKAPDDTASVAAALARGAIAGARGNSGIILSQVFRALAQSATGPLDADSVHDSLVLALELVNQAITEPVEGTIVTVLRAAANAPTGDLRQTVEAATTAAREALAETPSQLKVLRDAGVVDAGGAGLVILLEALLAELDGQPATHPTTIPRTRQPALEIMCQFTGDLQPDDLRHFGDSIIVAHDGTTAQVHLHSRKPGEAIEYLYSKGQVRDLRLEVLPERSIVAIVPDGPLVELFEAAGATCVNPGEPACADIVVSNGYGKGTVPTKHLVEGIAALAVYDPEAPIADAIAAMTEAATAMRTTVNPEDIVTATQELLREGGEQVTVLSPEPIDVAALEDLGVDVTNYPGAPHIEIGVE